MAFRRTIGFVLVTVALIVNGQHVTLDNVKDAGESGVKIPKSINYQSKLAPNLIDQDDDVIYQRIQLIEPRKDSFDDMSEYNDTDYHSIEGKPSKFDKDISDLIHTDLKSMHESEAVRLKAELDMEKTNTASNASETFETNNNQNNTRRMDTFYDEEEPTVQNDESDSQEPCNGKLSTDCLSRDLEHFIDEMSTHDVYNVTDYVQIVRNTSYPISEVSARNNEIFDKVTRYIKEHILRIRMPAEFSLARASRNFFGAIFQGKNSFLTGFGLGFLAFSLQKFMLPLFIGMQIIKSVIIALFLPSILGGIGRIVGKGVSTFSQVSQNNAVQPEENFDFKDNAEIYNDDYMHNQPIGTLPASAMYGQGLSNNGNQQYLGTPGVNQRISYANTLSDNYYSRTTMQGQGANKRQDYKVFHEIPSSSLLLTNYDPFYSPLLSRLDAVFSRLGHSTEGCREYAICAMYRNPGRYAPYSNLVSAQLSRELNELRKPTSDNPDVLRFFKYMKAAKDGQDGVQCEDVYMECASRGNPSEQNQAMLATYQDINKLVQARKI